MSSRYSLLVTRTYRTESSNAVGTCNGNEYCGLTGTGRELCSIATNPENPGNAEVLRMLRKGTLVINIVIDFNRVNQCNRPLSLDR